MKVVCCTALLLGLLVSPALAGTIDVYVGFNENATGPGDVQPTGYFPVSAGYAPLYLWAKPTNDAFFGWGQDLGLDPDGTYVSFTAAEVLINGLLFDPATAPDGDGLAGLVQPPGSVSGWALLATVNLTLNAEGTTLLMPGATPGDLNEGFVGYDKRFIPATYHGGVIVTPEPTALSLLALGGLALLRRR